MPFLLLHIACFSLALAFVGIRWSQNLSQDPYQKSEQEDGSDSKGNRDDDEQIFPNPTFWCCSPLVGAGDGGAEEELPGPPAPPGLRVAGVVADVEALDAGRQLLQDGAVVPVGHLLGERHEDAYHLPRALVNDLVQDLVHDTHDQLSFG